MPSGKSIAWIAVIALAVTVAYDRYNASGRKAPGLKRMGA